MSGLDLESAEALHALSHPVHSSTLSWLFVYVGYRISHYSYMALNKQQRSVIKANCT